MAPLSGMMLRVARLGRTLAYVPPAALVWRLWQRGRHPYFRSPFYQAREMLAERTIPTNLTWLGTALFPGDPAKGHAIAQGQWPLAGKTEHLGMPPRAWLPPRLQALQQFELHYHEWLADLRAANQPDVARRLLTDWLTHYSHYHPWVWHPYPLSLRIVSWLTHAPWLLAEAEANDDTDLRVTLTHVLCRQLAHLRQTCEWDLGGNHLLKNLKALLLGGVATQQPELATWAENKLLKALRHQVLVDGCHDERTPLYQAQVLQDVLEIRAALRAQGLGTGPVWDDLARQLGQALAVLTYPDGGLGLWNDSALNQPSRIATLLELAGVQPQHGSAVLPQGGYARLELPAAPGGSVGLLFDAGHVGPDENPGHAHADTLAFELWWGVQRVIVNQGTLAYQHPLRQILRSTAAHSTVAVGAENSAEVWGGFRVGRRPRHVTLQAEELSAIGRHDGYRHLGLSHTRKLRLEPTPQGATLHGTDHLMGKGLGRQRAVARFHLHPNVQVHQDTDTACWLTLPDGRRLRFHVLKGGTLTVQGSRYAPQFNELHETRQLVVRLTAPELSWQLATQA